MHQDPQLELLVDARATLGEGPAWDAIAGVLYWVDIVGKSVHIYDPETGTDRAVDCGDTVGTVAPCASGGVMVALAGSGFAHLDLETGHVTPYHDPEPHLPHNRFNDGKCDPAGRFWAGTLDWDEKVPSGHLYRLDTDRSCHTVLDDITIANGLTWSPDYQIMYYIDSAAKAVWAFDYDLDSGAITNRRTVIALPPEAGWPDGMTCDAEGMLWVAEWGSWCVKRWDPYTGECLRRVDVPAAHTSACCFGGSDLRDLYITSARYRIPEAELQLSQPTAGGLFRIRLDVPGIPTFSYGG